MVESLLGWILSLLANHNVVGLCLQVTSSDDEVLATEQPSATPGQSDQVCFVLLVPSAL